MIAQIERPKSAPKSILIEEKRIIWNRNYSIRNSQVAVIIQARMGSTRFPNKMLADICGKSMLERVIERVKLTGIKKIIVAIPDTPSDRKLASVASKCGVKIYLGSENDVLDRFYQAATAHSCIYNIVRITGDCPLIDPQVINDTVEFFLDSKYDYASNVGNLLGMNYPDGMDTEVFKFEVLDKIQKEATSQFDREHVCPYITTHPETFKFGYLQYKTQLPKYHWSVDRPEDLDFVREIYNLCGDNFKIDDVLNYCGIGSE